MLISKHFDPVMGIDIHFLIIPPAGPVPIPHPHIALVFDPFDYVPFIGATVKVGGLPRSTAGTAGKPIPHIPMGGPFAKPPMNENEIFMGSVTVLADGGPLSYTAVPSLSCHDIGLIAPPRKKKPKKSFGMVLPTSVVLSIPLGMPVMVGGAPTIDMMGLAMMGGFAALGGAFKKLRKMQKKSPRMKKISSAIHNRAKKAMDKLGVPPNIRNKVHKNICTVTGHPVDVATGKMFTDHVDFSLPGPLPLVWERTWYSTSVYDGPLGHGWHHSYDLELCEMDNAVAVRLADGRSVAFPALHINEKSFDRQERMTLLRDAEGYALDTKDKQRYRFTPFQGQAEKQLLTSLSQTTSGASIYFYYNEQAQLQQITDSGGRLIQFSHTDDGRIHKIFLPEPESNLTRDHTQHKSFCAVEHHYRNGMLVQVDDALQQPLQYHYDNTLLIKETFRSGLSFYFEYDGLDHNARCLRTWGDGGIYYRDIRYDTVNNITYVKNSHGHLTTYYHNGVLPHRVVDPLNHASLTEYNLFGEITRQTDPLGNSTSYEYNDAGHPVKVSAPDRSTQQVELDSSQNVLAWVNPMGKIWTYTYDSLNRLISSKDVFGNTTHYSYEGHLLSLIVDADNNFFNFSYDQNLNIRQLIEPNGNKTLWECDSLGNVIAIIDGRGNRSEFHRDRLSRIIRIIEADGSQRHITYDTAGNIIQLKNNQSDTQFSYSGMGRLVTRKQNGTTIKFEYDREEKLTAVINEHEQRYQFLLNQNGNVISETGFDGLTRNFSYDPCQRVIKIDRPASRYTLFTYAANGKPEKIQYSDGSFELFSYRSDGEVISATNANSTIIFERDQLGNVIKEICGEHWVSSVYNAMGQRIKIESSLGLNQNIERNQRGDPIKISTGTDHFEAILQRDAQGLELQRSLPGGIRSHWNRDRLGRPTQQLIFQGQHSSDEKTYSWGMSDKLIKIVDSLQRETIFTHDSIGNLVSVRYGDNNFEMRTPNAVGNLFRTPSNKDRTYGPAGQLLAIHGDNGTIHYQYDLEGNLIRKTGVKDQIWRYEWNGSGMLKKIILPDGSDITFEYDALGRRTKKTVNQRVTSWIWDGDNPLHEWEQSTKSASIGPTMLTDNPTALSRNHVGMTPTTWVFEPNSFSPIGKLTGDEYFSIISDYLGTANKMFDKHGEQVWSANISIWGELRELRGEKNNCPFRWPGQYEDSETGLYYNRFRYYDPEMGHYISQDPIRLHGGMEMYAYPLDPLIAYDPLGLILVYRLLRPDEDPLTGLNAKKPGRNMTPHGHVSSGSRNKGSQYISTSTDPKALEPWRGPDQTMVSFDTDDVVQDTKGNRSILDISDADKAKSHGVGAVSANMAAKSKEVLVEGHVPPSAITVCN